MGERHGGKEPMRMTVGKFIVRFGLRVALGPRDGYAEVTIRHIRHGRTDA
jgi:hypothetical protein